MLQVCPDIGFELFFYDFYMSNYCMIFDFPYALEIYFVAFPVSQSLFSP